MSLENNKKAFRICLANEKHVNETGDTLLGGINEHFVNMQATHVEIDGEIMEAEATYGDDGTPLVFIGLEVTKEYKEHLELVKTSAVDSKTLSPQLN